MKEKCYLVSDKKELATIMKNCFINITKDLELKRDSKGTVNNLKDILKVIQSHPIIEKIKKALILLKSYLFVI